MAPTGLLRILLAGAVLTFAVALPALAQEREGAELYEESCLSCHAAEGAGTEYGPPIENAGAAAANFQLRTGRMPLSDTDEQTKRKPPAFSDEEIEALVDYVASFGAGPEIPEVDPQAGDLSQGQELFVSNCAACHGATANGGAAGVGALAPSLYASAPLDIAEAVITGPGEMPVFDFTEHDRNSIVAYVTYLQNEDAPGGADIGGIGPVPEGFIGWTVGMLTLGLVAYLIGSRVKRTGAP